jgi:hypothetical protein
VNGWFYPLREWNWVFIALGVLWVPGARLVEGAWPPPVMFLFGALAISFGIVAAPALSRIINKKS